MRDKRGEEGHNVSLAPLRLSHAAAQRATITELNVSVRSITP